MLSAVQLGLPPADSSYLGDLGDSQAARAADMHPVAVEWGYHHPDNSGPGTWQVQAVIHRPVELISLLEET